MNITVKCFATLAKYQPENSDAFEVPAGTTVGQVMDMLGLDAGEVKIMFVNGKHVAPEAVLGPDDRVGLFPAVGGG